MAWAHFCDIHLGTLEAAVARLAERAAAEVGARGPSSPASEGVAHLHDRALAVARQLAATVALLRRPLPLAARASEP